MAAMGPRGKRDAPYAIDHNGSMMTFLALSPPLPVDKFTAINLDTKLPGSHDRFACTTGHWLVIF